MHIRAIHNTKSILPFLLISRASPLGRHTHLTLSSYLLTTMNTDPHQEVEHLEDILIPPSQTGFRIRISGNRFCCDITRATGFNQLLFNLASNNSGEAVPLPLQSTHHVQRTNYDPHRYRDLVYTNYTCADMPARDRSISILGNITPTVTTSDVTREGGGRGHPTTTTTTTTTYST